MTKARAKTTPKTARRRRRRPLWRWLPAAQRVVWAALGLALAIVLGGLAYGEIRGPGRGARVDLDWAPGGTRSEWAERLTERGLVSSPRVFALYLALLRPMVRFAPGPHVLSDDVSPRDLVLRLARSPGRAKVKVAIPEGFTRYQIAARLDDLGVCGRGPFLTATVDSVALGAQGVTAANAEGWLFPATYALAVDSAPGAVVERMIAETKRRLAELALGHPAAHERLRSRGYGDQELLTLSSIVERESASPEERATIAGVFYRRLHDETFQPRGRLQSDPTAAYGCLAEPERAPSCAGFDGRVTPAMLRDERNRYNTYRNAGLPPGPIANPGAEAIVATLAPTESDYLYFVANGSGGHTFSRTLEEHEQATARLRAGAER